MITKEGKHHILPSDITEKQSEKSAEHSLVFVIVHLMKLWATKWIAWEHTLFLGVLLLGLEVGSGGGGGGVEGTKDSSLFPLPPPRSSAGRTQRLS